MSERNPGPPPPQPAPPAPQPAPASETWQVHLARHCGVEKWSAVFAEIQQGRGFRAEQLLQKRRKEAPSDAERRRIDEVLAVRRIFAEEVRGTPGLGRFNGVGTGMYGESGRDAEDGTYVKTQFFSFLWLPVFPLSQWLVRDAENGGWYFLAKVPLSRVMKIWQLAAGAAAVAAVVVTVAVTSWVGSHPRVHLLNALPAEAQVAIDEETPRSVTGGGRESFRLASGKHRFVCRVGDRVVDDRVVDLPFDTDFAAYSVAGSAPLTFVHVPYMKERSASRDPPEATMDVLAGEVWVTKAGVDHVFEEPPKEVSMKGGASVVWRVVAELGGDGWRGALELLEDSKDEIAAADLAERFALAVPTSSELTLEATARSKAARSEEDHRAFLDRLGEAKAAAPR